MSSIFVHCSVLIIIICQDLRADWQDQKNLVADLETELHRADRREANAKEELEEFKKLEGLVGTSDYYIL